MLIKWDAVELFLAYLAGTVKAADVLAHPAYVAVRLHSRLAWGRELRADDLDRAVAGQESPFFGLRDVRDNTGRIRDFVALARSQERQWVQDVYSQLAPVTSRADLALTKVYPIVGYDAGIGLSGLACLNINWPIYLGRPHEFVYMMAHELSHVLYGRRRPIPEISQVQGSAQWSGLFDRMTQDEGFAVHASLELRTKRGHLGNGSHPILYDYVVLSQPELLAAHVACWRRARRTIATANGRDRSVYLELVFGAQRLTYRVGAAIARRIAEVHGRDRLKEAFAMSGTEFVEAYSELVAEKVQ